MFYDKIKTNFHTHTIFCGHATDLPIDFLPVIKKYHFETFGFSEHAYIDIPSFHHTIKSDEQMDKYYEEVQRLKNATDIEILTGLEIDYIPSFLPYYEKLNKKFDYLSLSVHFVAFEDRYSYATRFHTVEELKLYSEYMESGMKTGLFAFVNHPDLFLTEALNERKNDEYIIKMEEKIINDAIKYDIPLELNIAQYERYRSLYEEGSNRSDFWYRVGKTNAKVIVNFDCHNLEHITLEIYNEVMLFSKVRNLKIITDFRSEK